MEDETGDLRQCRDGTLFRCVVVELIGTHIRVPVGGIANLSGIHVVPAVALDQTNTVSGSQAEVVGTDEFLVGTHIIGKLNELRFQ